MSPPINPTTSSDTTTVDTASTTTANTSAQTLVPATPGIRTSALEQTRTTTVSLDASTATDFLGFEDTLRSSGESSGNTTINSPEYISQTARKVREEFQHQPRSVIQREQVTALEGLKHVELMRTLEEKLKAIVPGIIWETVNTISQQGQNYTTQPPTNVTSHQATESQQYRN